MVLLRASGRSSYCETAASFTLGGAIELKFDVETPLSATDLSASVSKMLVDQLGLTTEQVVTKADDGKVTSVSFRSTAALRNSEILKNGWREALDFDLNISVNNKELDIYGKASPLVCRQAAGVLTAYHGPDDAQRKTYALTLNGLVEKAISNSCKQFSKVDDRRLVCK